MSDQLEILPVEPARWTNAVDEILRLESPVQMTARIANRDPAAFNDPSAFDVRRENAARHLACTGHFCLGAALARLEGTRRRCARPRG